MRTRGARSRRSPLYAHLVEANANFGSRNGWERANFFAPAGSEPEYSFGASNLAAL